MPNGFFASFLYRDCSPIGLDVGHDAIKMLQLRRAGQNWQVAAQAVHVFGEEVRRNPALRWQSVAPAVRSMLNNRSLGRFRGRRTVAALGHDQVLVKNSRLPRMPGGELDEAVRWEASERFPFDVAGGVVRHLVAGDVRQGGEHRQEVLMFAVGDQTLRECLGQLQQAGVHPVGLDAKAIALARAMDFFLPSDPGAAEGGGSDQDALQFDPPVRVIADLGSQSCELVIGRDGRIVFVKNIEIGTNDVNRAVAEKIGTSFEDTAALRRRLGQGSPTAKQGDWGPRSSPGGGPQSQNAAMEGPGPGAPEDSLTVDAKVRRAVTTAMRPIVERLAHEITLCLRYSSVTFRGHRPDRLTLVGGASHDRLLIQLAEEALGMRVEVGWPLASCMPDPAAVLQADQEAGGGEWAVALGCCLKPILEPRRRRQARPAAETAAPAGPVGGVAGEPLPERVNAES